MLKDIFIPERIGSFFLFTQRIVGIEFTKTHVLTVVIKVRRSNRVIEQLIEEPIDQDILISYQERAAQALKKVLEKVGSYSYISAVISSGSVIFKEISVPLMSTQKMKMITPFEVESLLPFSLDTAAVDSITMYTDPKTRKADLLVAAVKQDVLDKFLEIFSLTQAGAVRVTTDIIELYGLYRWLPDYAHSTNNVLLVEMGAHTTCVALLINNHIKAVRVIARGQVQIEENPQEIVKLISDLKMTLESFQARIPVAYSIEKMIISGPLVDMKEAHERIGTALNLPYELMGINKILHTGSVQSKNSLSNKFIIPLAAALPLGVTELFNFNQKSVDRASSKLLGKQLIVAACLVFAIFVALFTYQFWVSYTLRKEIAVLEKQAIDQIKSKLSNITVRPGKKGGMPSLDQVNSMARAEVNKQESIWFAISNENRFSFLVYLQDLSTRVNREELGLEIKRLTLNEDSDIMTLEGQVKNFEALRTLREDISQSKMFKEVSNPQELKFTMKITLDKSYRAN